jgi:hypothetical protein
MPVEGRFALELDAGTSSEGDTWPERGHYQEPTQSPDFGPPAAPSTYH